MAFVLPASLTTLLEAVNTCLSAVGEAPVNDIFQNEAVDVADAKNILLEWDKAVQSKGWSWNREDAVVLNPDQNGHIHLPNNTLRVARAYPLRASSGTGRTGKAVQRGDRLYNRSDNTFVWDTGVECDLIVRHEWTDLPEPARAYITIAAAQQMQGRKQVSATVDRILDRQVVSALAILEQNEDEVEANNGISGNASVQSALYGRGTRRNRTRG